MTGKEYLRRFGIEITPGPSTWTTYTNKAVNQKGDEVTVSMELFSANDAFLVKEVLSAFAQKYYNENH